MPEKFTGGTKYLLQFKQLSGTVVPDGSNLLIYPYGAAQDTNHLMDFATVSPTPAGGTGGLVEAVLLPGVQYTAVGVTGSGFSTQNFTTTANVVDPIIVTSSS